MSQNVKIEKLDHQGRGIVRTDGKIIFVENALPGEEVEIEVIKEKKQLKEARVTSYQSESLDRRIPPCPYYETCGGCHIMHMTYEKQLEWKQEKVKEILQKFLDKDISFPIRPIIASEELGYRNKVTFQVDSKIGYYEKGSNQIVPVKHCDLISKKMNLILSKLSEMQLDNCSQIVIRASENFEQIMVIFHTNTDINQKQIIEALQPYVTSMYIKNKQYECIYGDDAIEEKLGDYIFTISPDSFFQVNTKQAEKMYELVKKYAALEKEDSLLDLYCGTGTIGLYLSDKCKKVLGVEINGQAVEDAKKNRQANHIENAEFVCSDVANIVDQIKDHYSVVIVDPPRSGLDTKTISYLKQWNVKRIVYVSCDPVTLARDLNLLKDVYEVIEVTPIDMFPQTYHVETVVCLQKK